MRLKCIGGPNDNEYWDVLDYLKIGDQLRIPQQKNSKVLDYIPSIDEIFKATVQEYEIYKIGQIYASNNEQIKILIHNNLSWFEALKYQFEKDIPHTYVETIKQMIIDFGHNYSPKSNERKLIKDLAKFLNMNEAEDL